ncbi:MAG: hypothetical protein HPY69_01150 [Armatimonadetes bacterium]|nr:hypothetical protein [Armatimonadota bacterium]
MVTLGIVLAVGYFVIFAVCRKAAQADQTVEVWVEPATMQVTMRPVPQTAPVGQALPRTG